MGTDTPKEEKKTPAKRNYKAIIALSVLGGLLIAGAIFLKRPDRGRDSAPETAAVQGERSQGPEQAAPAATQSTCSDFTSTLNVCRVTSRSGSGWMRKAPGTAGEWRWDIDDMSNLAEVWYLDGSGQQRRYNLNGRDNDQAYAWRFVPKPGKAIAVRYRIG